MVEVKKKVADMTREEKQAVVLKEGKRSPWISCPVCHRGVPLNVKVDENGAPLREHEGGVIFKRRKDHLERRFAGPGVNYLPFFIRCQYGRYGVFTDVSQSLTVGNLRRVDEDLFNDFKTMLERTRLMFL